MFGGQLTEDGVTPPRAAPPAVARARQVGPKVDWIRLVDIAGALVVLAFVFPLMLSIAAVVWGQDGGSPLFSQRRIGRRGREFACYKFRSMRPDAEKALVALLAADPQAREEWKRDQKLRHDPRITRFGAFMRKTSLDELPQLFNVLRGEMSLVGPRPIVADEIPRFGRRFKTYCSVRPGLTGLWQVSGRTEVDYRRRVAMDVVYARNCCLGLYLRVLLATLPAVLFRRGAW